MTDPDATFDDDPARPTFGLPLSSYPPIPAWVSDDAAVARRVNRKLGAQDAASWWRVAELLTHLRVLTTPFGPPGDRCLDALESAATIALELADEIDPPPLARLSPPESDPEPVAVLREWGPRTERLDTAGSRLAAELDQRWTCDDELAALLSDVVHELGWYAVDVLASLKGGERAGPGRRCPRGMFAGRAPGRHNARPGAGASATLLARVRPAVPSASRRRP